MLPADSSRRLLAELRGALDACAGQQRQLERSLRVCRRLLRAWEPGEGAAAEPGAGPEASPPPASAPSPPDLGEPELELLTRALEKAARVRSSVARARSQAPGLKPAPRVSAPAASPRPAGRNGGHAPGTGAPRGSRQTLPPAKTSGLGPLSAGDPPRVGRASRAAPGPRGPQTAPARPAADPRAPGPFTLREKGTLLQLPVAFREAAAQNSRLWAQLSSPQRDDAAAAASAARARFLRKLQAAPARGGLSAAEAEAEAGRLRRACALLTLRLREELAAEPADPRQEYRCLLTLEGLRALAGRLLRRLQRLRAAVAEQQLTLWPEERPPWALAPGGGGEAAAAPCSPQLLLYSGPRELQTLAALRLRVAMLGQQLRLEKVLMAELLPLAGAPEPPGPALCRALHSLLCEGGQRFPSVLRGLPAD